MSAFEELGLTPELIRAVEKLDWLLPTPIQAEAIPLILGGGDVLAAAETGSGKTGAFGLPILQAVHETLTGRSGKASGGGAAARVVLSEDDADASITISKDGTKAELGFERWEGVRSNAAILKGKYYYEVEVVGESKGVVRVGFSSGYAKLDLGTDTHGYGYGGTAKKSNNRRFDDYGNKYGTGDVVGCMVDKDNGTISYTLNGVELGGAFNIKEEQKRHPLHAHVCIKNQAVVCNFGAKRFKYNPPEGYRGMAKAEAGDIQIKEETLKGDDGPLAIVLEPTLDLAQQTFDYLQSYADCLRPALRILLCSGGGDMEKQKRKLKTGVDIVVGTTGRISSFAESGILDVRNTRYFCVDEADRMLDKSNQDAILSVFTKINKRKVGADRLQVLLFSATLYSDEIQRLSNIICQNPTWVDMKGKDAVPESVTHFFVSVDPAADKKWRGKVKTFTDGVHAKDNVSPDDPKPESRSEGIKRLKQTRLLQLIENLELEQAIIFCRTNVDCDNLEKFLQEAGGGRGFKGKAEKGKENPYSCVVLAGFRRADERKRNLQHFKDGDVRFMICTDVAARGIDIHGLPCVINVTLPAEPEDYIHRIGRVGRADKYGLAISLVATQQEKVWFHTCKSKGREGQCSNTQLVDQGGCTTWYSEPDLRKQVEARLGQPIPELPKAFKDGQAFYTLPKNVSMSQLGEARGGGASAETAKHVENMRPQVLKLQASETKAQDSFWKLKAMFSGR
mmetsp:Transcript_21214/g.55176  ORF Transcript_21214/g.55176 Transcript_21214/m.55176 type:complete len:735 (-) Transcript_21214:161-2365(-)